FTVSPSLPVMRAFPRKRSMIMRGVLDTDFSAGGIVKSKLSPMMTTSPRKDRPLGSQVKWRAEYIADPMMQRKITTTHSPAEIPLRGSGFEVAAHVIISSKRRPPQAIGT